MRRQLEVSGHQAVGVHVLPGDKRQLVEGVHRDGHVVGAGGQQLDDGGQPPAVVLVLEGHVEQVESHLPQDEPRLADVDPGGQVAEEVVGGHPVAEQALAQEAVQLLP